MLLLVGAKRHGMEVCHQFYERRGLTSYQEECAMPICEYVVFDSFELSDETLK